MVNTIRQSAPPDGVAMTAQVVAIRDLHVQYGELEAVRGIDLDINPSETFGLLGPNGAGKTTTLSCIEGLLTPTSGTVEVFGLDVPSHAAAVKARIGIPLQQTALYPVLNLMQLLELFAAMYDRFPTGGQLRQPLDRLQLGDKATAKASELSGGQQQRLALAIALVNDPELVILDEPTSGLDPQARRGVWEIIADLRREGRTVLLTTHYMEEAEALCGRVAIIDHGQILALGSPTELVRGLDGRVTILATVELPLTEVRQLPGVLDARYLGERLEIPTGDAAATEVALRELADRHGRMLRDVVQRQSTLEDVFLALTGRTIRE